MKTSQGRRAAIGGAGVPIVTGHRVTPDADSQGARVRHGAGIIVIAGSLKGLVNTAGDVVDEGKWKEEYEVESKGIWKRPVISWPSGTFPRYRHGETTIATDENTGRSCRNQSSCKAKT